MVARYLIVLFLLRDSEVKVQICSISIQYMCIYVAFFFFLSNNIQTDFPKRFSLNSQIWINTFQIYTENTCIKTELTL